MSDVVVILYDRENSSLKALIYAIKMAKERAPKRKEREGAQKEVRGENCYVLI